LKILDILIEPFIKLLEVKNEVPNEVDVIVGIGTGLKADGSCSPQSKAITEKCVIFLNLDFCQSRKIIFTSGNFWGGPREAEAMRDFAVELGVPRANIIVEVESKNTRENAIETQAVILKESGIQNHWKNILIVADRIHARKVRACFRKIFEDPLLRNSFKVYIAKAYTTYDSKVPQKRLRSKTRFFFWELFSYVIFKLKGWI